MPLQYNIYFEYQNSGLCRLHSINAYFGCPKISISEFNKHKKDYDIEYSKKFNFDISCSSFDIVASDQNNIISYILKKYNIYTRYYAINQIFNKNINDIINILKGDFFFIYNDYHIYGIRRKNNIWYIVDSNNGVTVSNINILTSQKNIGIIVPVYIKQEFYHNLRLIKEIMNYKTDLTNIKEYLISTNKSKLILGELEIPLSICVDILETQYNTKKSPEFDTIKKIIIIYNKFLSNFTKGQYNNLDLILTYLPCILLKLTALTS